MYPFFCFLSFFALPSNVRWRKVLKRTKMLLHFTFLILSKYGLQIRWALTGLNQGFLSLIQHRLVSLFPAHHWKFHCLLMVLRLFPNKVFDYTALFCFFNSLICSWRKLLSLQSWWTLPSSLSLILLISSFKILQIFQRYHCLMLL